MPSSEASAFPFLWLRSRIPADRGLASTGPSPGTLSTLTAWASTARPRPSTGSGPGQRVHLPGPARPPLHRQPDAATMLVRAGHASSVTLRQLALPRPVRTWSLTTLREKLIKIGAKVVHHARAVTFQLAEVAVPRELFAALLARIGRLRAAPSPG